MNYSKYYQFRVRGHLDDALQNWFEGFEIINLEYGEALIQGYIRDQSALHGVIDKIEGLGLPLLTVNLMENPGNSTAHIDDT